MIQSFSLIILNIGTGTFQYDCTDNYYVPTPYIELQLARHHHHHHSSVTRVYYQYQYNIIGQFTLLDWQVQATLHARVTVYHSYLISQSQAVTVMRTDAITLVLDKGVEEYLLRLWY